MKSHAHMSHITQSYNYKREMLSVHSHYPHQQDRDRCALLMRIDTRFNVDSKKTVFNPQKQMPTYATTIRNNVVDSRTDIEMDVIDSDELAAMYSIEEEERLNRMIVDNKFDLVYNEIKDTTTPTLPPTTTKLLVKQVQTADALMEKLNADYLEPICITFEEILRNFRHKGKPLIGELYDNKEELTNVVTMYINRMVLGLLSLDKAGMKLAKMIDRVESLYYCSGFVDDPNDPNPKKKRKLPVFVPKFMNDFSNVDCVRGMMEKRVKNGTNKYDDDFFKILSSAKQRGRRKKNAIEYSYNPLELIAKSYIKSKKLETTKKTNAAANIKTNVDTTSSSEEEEEEDDDDDNNEVKEISEVNEDVTTTTTTKSNSAVDQYPTFQKCLEILNQSIPRNNNHGLYLGPISDYNRYLDNTDFPSHGLISTINNMFCCVTNNIITMSFDQSQRRFYCAITGEEIRNGEEVRRLLFIERDSEREKDWVDFKIVEPRVFEHEKITKSVRTYLIKMKSTIMPITLFPKKRSLDDLQSTTESTIKSMKNESNICDGDGDEIVTKKRKIDIKQKKKKKLVIRGKDYVRKTIINLLTTLKSHPNPEKLFHNNKKYYTIENERVNKMLGLINNKNFQAVFDKILLYVVLSSYTTEEQKLVNSDEKYKARLKYDKNRLFDDLIDFILIMDDTSIPYSSLHPVISILFKLSLQKKNPSMNRFSSFTEWEPYFKEHLLFFLTIIELMGVVGNYNNTDAGYGNSADCETTPDLLENFNFKLQ